MKIYALSGLGADSRVFDFLELEHEVVPIEWITPLENESIESYSKRLSRIIDTSQEFSLMGVSFGGLIAVEISKILHPRLTILISSVETKNELRLIYRIIGRSGIIRLLPSIFFDPPRFIMPFLFGTSNKNLLDQILDETDLKFAKWAVGALTTWQNLRPIKQILRIHGDADLLLPWKGKSGKILEKSGHLMIVDQAKEVSELINTALAKWKV